MLRWGLVGALTMLLAACGFGTTGDATDINHRSATLTGIAENTEPGLIIHWFDWGLTAEYGQSTTAEVAEITGPIPVEGFVDGLSADTEYHYRLCVTDHRGHGVCGEDRTFRTERGDE